MPARRLLMRKIREVLRLKHEQGLSHQAVAQACAVGVGTVNRYLQRAAQRGLGWPLPDDLDDAALEARLFRRRLPRGGGPSGAGVGSGALGEAVGRRDEGACEREQAQGDELRPDAGRGTAPGKRGHAIPRSEDRPSK